MNMKRLLTLVAFFATLQASAQQVNPVPDYVFANRMSAGRNTVTDTAAYFSIGPRYGATRGMMPPMVVDTASFSANKRNGLLIFSVQKNKFLYWDSVRVQWSDMAGSSGAYIVAGDTSAMLAPYLRKVDTTSMLTAYLRKGDTSSMLSPYYRSATASAALALKLNISDTSTMLSNYIIGSGSTNYFPKFIGTRTEGNSKLRNADSSLYYEDSNLSSGGVNIIVKNIAAGGPHNYSTITLRANNDTVIGSLFADGWGGIITNRGLSLGTSTNHLLNFRTNGFERMRINTDGEIFINRITDAGNYNLQITGDIYNSGGAALAATTGSVGIGTVSPQSKLHVFGSGTATGVKLTLSNGGDITALNDPLGVIDFYSDDASAGLQGTKGYLGVYNEFNGNWDGSGSRYDTYMAFGTSLDNSLSEKMRIKSDAELLINTTSDAGDYKLQVSGNIYNTGSLTTGAPSGGSIKPWKIGEAATVSPTSPNRTIRVEIDGVVYYLHAKTTND